MKKSLLGIAVGLLLTGRVFAADTFTIDNVHSSIGFAVKHMMVSTTTGTFDDYTGSITYDPADLSTFKAEATVQAKSINTRNEGRDKHLRTADFFDVEKFPTITFTSKSLTGQEGEYEVIGDLTMHGVTKEITIPVKIEGPVKNPMGESMVLGLEGKTVINRKDFGITWNKDLDAGGLALGNEVTINLFIEAHKK